jgi:quinol monooxygenase YgiN
LALEIIVLRRVLFGFSFCVLALTATPVAAQQAAPVAGPLYVVVRIEVLHANEIAAAPLLERYAMETREAPGNLRTELLEENAGPVSTFLEVWRDKAAYDASLAAPPEVRLQSRMRNLIGAAFDVRECHALAGSGELPTTVIAPNRKSVYVVTYLDFLPDHTDYGIAGMRRYLIASRGEPGAVRLEILQEAAANHFVISEVWGTKRDYERHLASPTTLRFRHEEAKRPWLGAPYGTAVSRLIL